MGAGERTARGVPIVPPLFNIFHQAVMRLAESERVREAGERGEVAGVGYKWVPGSALPSEGTWEKENSEAILVVLLLSLFADDTTVVGCGEELERGVAKVKEVMGRFEEKNNDDKEEVLEFGSSESGRIRMLGSFMGWKEDVEERLKRGRKAWWVTKKRLRGAKISRRCQARVVEASVEATLLFDCQARTWTSRELRRLQSFMDGCYRSVWSKKGKAPLMQMQEEHMKMEDVRRELGVRSVRWKVEKRVLERIGHVMRMGDDRMVKGVVLGWWDKLEEVGRVPGRRRKTVLYWRRLLREAGVDWTRIGQLTADRKEWKEVVRKRMKRVLEWENSRGHHWSGNRVEVRNATVEERRTIGHVCEVCGKVCVSKGGLTVHRRRLHEVSELKKKFGCERCGREFVQEANLKNHRKVCMGEGDGTVVSCDLCEKSFKRKGFKKHRRSCAAKRGVVTLPSPPPLDPQPRVYRGRRMACPECGKLMAATNIRRHITSSCPGQRA